MIGPAPHYRSKVQDIFRQVLFVKHENRRILLRIQYALEKTAGARAQFDLF